MKNNQLAPIVLFTYNRPLHTEQVLNSLSKNVESKDSILYVFCDGARENSNEDDLVKIEEVRKLINTENRFKKVVIKVQEKNKGLANSIIDGVTAVVNRYGKVIVLEDDIVVSNKFLSYMNWALNSYSEDTNVANISGFTFNLEIDRKLVEHDSFFLSGAECWGWATWERAWKFFEPNGQILLNAINNKNLINEFDCDGYWGNSKMLLDQIDGKNNSWWIRWHASCFCNQLLTLYPTKSFTKNIGFDGSGVHCGIENIDVKQIKNFVYIKIPLKKLSVYDWHKFYLAGRNINSNGNDLNFFKKYFFMNYIFKILKSLKNRLKKVKKNIAISYFKFKFSQELRIFTHLTFDEKRSIYNIIKSLKGSPVCVEIGSYFGASSCFISSALTSKGVLYCIDTWGNHAMVYSENDLKDELLVEKDTYEIFKKNTLEYKEKIRELRGWSTEVVVDFKKLEKKIDFIFIDGDHSYDGVKKDWNAYFPFFRKGSIVAFHDTGWAEGVNKLIREEVCLVADLEVKLPNLETYKIR
jgi:predicted O-methyltransferase YrrM